VPRQDLVRQDLARQVSVAHTPPNPAAPLALSEGGSGSGWLRIFFLAFAVIAVAAATVPVSALPPPLARRVERRRFEIVIAGLAGGLGIVVGVIVTVLLS
jgi:hypothetical protein